MIRILVCGDRNWSDENKITITLIKAIKYLWEKKGLPRCKNLGFDPSQIILIEGEASGADKLSRRSALSIGIPECNILKFPAPWNDIEGKSSYQIGIRRDKSKYWKAAGPFRNTKMLVEGQPELVLAFHNNIESSKGTADMVKKSIKAGVETRVFKESDCI